LLGRFILTRSFIREGLSVAASIIVGVARSLNVLWHRGESVCSHQSRRSGGEMVARVITMILLLASAAAAAPKLVITEIMYDPTSPESDDQQTEWVEIQNLGEQTINLQGYQITSGSKTRPHDPKQRFVIRDAKIE